jgi:hypothetical protein
VFWIGANGDVSSNWQNDTIDGGRWHQQFGIAFPGSVRADSPLWVLNRHPEQQDAFWIGANGDVSSNWQNNNIDGGRWHQQFGIAIPGSVRPGSPLVVRNRYPQQQDVLWIGANGDVSSQLAERPGLRGFRYGLAGWPAGRVMPGFRLGPPVGGHSGGTLRRD